MRVEDYIEDGAVFEIGQFCVALAGKSREDLEDVSEATLVGLDTDREATHELGTILPELLRLRLKQSTVRSFRDFGCDLSKLRVLHAARCGISDLDGAAALECLEELYLSFNDVEDCCALAMHERLTVLDLECNRVSDLTECSSLATCETLSCLTLLGNPVAREDDYRSAVARRMPLLEVLDDAPLGSSQPGDVAVVDIVETPPRGACCSKDQSRTPADEAALDEFIRQEAALTIDAVKAFRPGARPAGGASSEFASIHPCWADLCDLRGAGSIRGAGSALTRGGRAAMTGRVRPSKASNDDDDVGRRAILELQSRAKETPRTPRLGRRPGPAFGSPEAGSPGRPPEGCGLSARPGTTDGPPRRRGLFEEVRRAEGPSTTSPRAAETSLADPARTPPEGPRRAGRVDETMVIKPTSKRASPRTDLVRELLGADAAPNSPARPAPRLRGSASSPALRKVAPAPELTSRQRSALARKQPQRKKKLHHAVSTMDLARRSAAKNEFSGLDPL